jgi:hypothetical protein
MGGAAAFLGHLERQRGELAARRPSACDGLALDRVMLGRVVLFAEQEGIDGQQRRDAARDGGVGGICAGLENAAAGKGGNGQHGERGQQEAESPGGPGWEEHRAIVCPPCAAAVPSKSAFSCPLSAFSSACWPAVAGLGRRSAWLALHATALDDRQLLCAQVNRPLKTAV